MWIKCSTIFLVTSYLILMGQTIPYTVLMLQRSDNTAAILEQGRWYS